MHDPATGVACAVRDSGSGFRLNRLEVRNWGAFDERGGVLDLGGCSGLLTGDAGSGPSDLADAIVTLLAPVGAGAPERDACGRDRGRGGTDGDALIGATRPVRLREAGTCSVILGVFRDEACDATVTLAQVFWVQAPGGQVARMYVGAERELSISEHFGGVGGDMAKLRLRLHELNCNVADVFSEHGAWLMPRLGIENVQVLWRFRRTATMGSAANLDDFVRNHVLDPIDGAACIDALISRVDDADRARVAVMRAKRQVAMLAPLIEHGDRFTAIGRRLADLRACRDGLRAHFARTKLKLVDERLVHLDNVLERLNLQIERLEARRHERRTRADELRLAVAGNGGDRIDRLGAEIRRLEGVRDSRRLRAERYGALAKRVGEAVAANEAAFIAQRMRLKSLRNAARDRDATLDHELTEQHVAFRQGELDRDELRVALEDLRKRHGNIDADRARMRSMLCAVLGIPEAELPFAGELMQVRDDARDWEGAAERLLREFGLSLLVPDAHFDDVSSWVERNDLHGRLVYLRVRPVPTADSPELHPDSIVRKLAIKPDYLQRDWMAHELARRFDLACCTTQARFREEARAITRAGHIKDPAGRGEKDDRHPIDERSRCVLGWSNAPKIAVLEAQLVEAEGRLKEIADRIDKVHDQRKLIGERLDALARLEEFVAFDDLDWGSLAKEVRALADARHHLETASDVLQHLNEQISRATESLVATEKELGIARDRRSRILQRKADAHEMRKLAQAVIEQAAGRVDPLSPDELAQRLEAARVEALGANALLGIEACDHHEQATRALLQGRIDAEEAELRRLSEEILRAMMAFRAEFALETAGFDAGLNAVGEYRRLLARLRDEEVPRLEACFKALLDGETSRAIASFSDCLSRGGDALYERIARINASLVKIDDRPERCIVLEAQPASDAEFLELQAQLRACMADPATGADDAQRSEAKFMQVKAIVERFRGRDGLSEQDRRWTARVTDVRNAFRFAASERLRSGDAVRDSDPSDPPGLPPDELACAILAASLASGLGFDGGEQCSRSFRFVLIDEAIGCGSDAAMQYGLRLLRQLGLQVLVVASQSRSRIIESNVSRVGFVRHEGACASSLSTMTVESYQAAGCGQ